jgi:beta-glucosidase
MTGSWMSYSLMGSRRSRPFTTGTCRKRCKIVADGKTRDTASALAQYAGYVAEKLGDRARHFFTFNECWTFVELGHATGVFAPGLKLPPGRLNQVRHHVLLAHGLAVKAIRERSPARTQIGPAENVTICVPVIETPEHIAAAELATRELNASYLTAMMEGSYRESFLAAAGVDAEDSRRRHERHRYSCRFRRP